jgi:hypothetical protein
MIDAIAKWLQQRYNLAIDIKELERWLEKECGFKDDES